MSYETIHQLNVFLGGGAILLQVLSVIALGLLFIRSRNFYLDFISRHYLMLGFGVSFVASLFTLIYSEIVGFVPCHLCWYQRIFMIPMPFIFGVALWVKDRKIVKYVLPLLLVGFSVALYQSLIYYFKANASSLPCDASGVSCYQHLISVFGGYISYPMLSLTSFLALITIVLVARYYDRGAR